MLLFCIITFILVSKYYLILTNYDAVFKLKIFPISQFRICSGASNNDNLHIYFESFVYRVEFILWWVDGTEILIYKNIICKLFNFEKQNGCDSKMSENLFKKYSKENLLENIQDIFILWKGFIIENEMSGLKLILIFPSVLPVLLRFNNIQL